MIAYRIESIDLDRNWTSDIWCCFRDGHGSTKSSTLSRARLIIAKLSERWQIPLSDYRIVEENSETNEVIDIHYLDKNFFKKIFVTEPEREILSEVLQDWLDGLSNHGEEDAPFRGATRCYSHDEVETILHLIENISENSVVFVKRHAK